MNEKLEALKPLLKAGEYEKASSALKEYRAEFPDDWDGKLMEGIVAQLKGDEETFKRIHDEAQAVINTHGKDTGSIKTSPLWRKYRTTWERVATAAIVGIVVGGAVLTSAVMISKAITDGATIIGKIKAAESNSIFIGTHLYGGPIRIEKIKDTIEINGEDN